MNVSVVSKLVIECRPNQPKNAAKNCSASETQILSDLAKNT